MRGEREVARFAESMLEKLAENKHKPEWKDEHPAALLQALEVELCELWDEVQSANPDPARIRRECADIGNFAMMVADASGGLGEEQ